jgi:hypothetical protein
MAKRKTKIELTSAQLKVISRGIHHVWNDIAADLEMDDEFDNFAAIECCVDANRLERADKEAGEVYRKIIDSLPGLDGYYEFLKYLGEKIELL